MNGVLACCFSYGVVCAEGLFEVGLVEVEDCFPVLHEGDGVRVFDS